MKPKFLRCNLSCPSCGHVIDERDYDLYINMHGKGEGFNCKICKNHWSNEDFWEENREKNSLGGFRSNEKIFSLIEELEND